MGEKSCVKITEEDVEEEITFWNSAIVCYVLGANPPMNIIEGFFRRVWAGKVDRVGSPRHGIFIVRFNSVEIRDDVLQKGVVFFNKRPVIMKPWDAEVSLTKSDIRSVPIWIQLENLELKYWGEKILFKIVGQIGSPIKFDVYTKEKNRLSYPRILIEVQLEQKLLETVQFEGEYGRLNEVKIVYEWKPTICKHCSGVGHETEMCRKHVPKKHE